MGVRYAKSQIQFERNGGWWEVVITPVVMVAELVVIFPAFTGHLISLCGRDRLTTKAPPLPRS